MSLYFRANDIAAFLQLPLEDCYTRLKLGFGYQHARVTEDFRCANPQTDLELLEWYRKTDAYIWELSAYHEDPGFNYSGMCQGISQRLQTSGVKTALCLGDGIGDLSLTLSERFHVTYHDLAESRTAQFARFRFVSAPYEIHLQLTPGWDPRLYGSFDAVVSLDFLEHVTDVPSWVGAIKNVLKPGGLFCAQNAFALGSGPNGSMPMHLERNDRFEKDWDPLLSDLGFIQESSNWYRRAA